MNPRIKNTLRKHSAKIRGKTNIHLLHIGKTGGSSLKFAFSKLTYSSSYTIFSNPHKIKLEDIPRGERVIFSIRDPISKFVSGFYSRKRQGLPKYNYPWTAGESNAFSRFQTPDELATALSSEQILYRKHAEDAMQSIQHVSASYWDWFKNENYFDSRLSDIFFIFRQTHLAEDFHVFKSKTGLMKDIQLPVDNIQSHRNPTCFDKNLSDLAIQNLKTWYKRDIDFMNIADKIAADLMEIDTYTSP